MKIIHIVPSIGIEASGPSQSVKGLCQSLFNLDEDVILASMDYPDASPSESISDLKFGIVFPMGLGPLRMGRSPALFEWLNKEVCDGERILCHNHGMWQLMCLYGSRVSKASNVTLIQSPRNALSEYSLRSGSRLKPLFWKMLQKRALQRVDCFHATCEAEYRDIRALGFTQPVAIIPNGVDIPAISPVETRTDGRVLTYLGRLHPEKGLDNLLSAWQSIQSNFKNWRLQLIGPGDKRYIEHLKELAFRLELDAVDFLGPMYTAKKWEAYRNADLYILPSPSENFGMTIAEALASGTPVITTKGAPWAELSAENAGWWVDCDSDSLGRAMHEAMSLTSEERSRMGTLGRQWMINDFSWDGRAKKMLEVYNWLVSGGLVTPDCLKLD
jgi:glycosyltransferase involved in cell wall biosynthesis